MLNLGGITFGLGIDASRLVSAQSQVQNFGNVLTNAMKASKGAMDEVTRGLAAQEKAAVSSLSQIASLTERVNRMKIDPQVKLNLLGDADKQIAQLTNMITKVGGTKAKPVAGLVDPVSLQRAIMGTQELIAETNRSARAAADAQRAEDQLSRSYERQDVSVLKATGDLAKLNAEIAKSVSSGRISPTFGAALSAQASGAMTGYSQKMTMGDPVGTLEGARANQQLAQSFAAVRAEITQANQGFTQANALEREETQAATSATRALERQQVAMIRAAGDADRLADALKRVMGSGKVSNSTGDALHAQVQSALATYQNTMASGALSAPQAAAAQQIFRSALSGVRTELKQTIPAGAGFVGIMRGIGTSAMFATGPMGGLAFRIQAATSLISEYGLVSGGIAAGILGLATSVAALTTSIVHSTVQMQQATMALQALSGSAVQAAGDLEYVRKVSDMAGINLNEAASGYARLAIAGQAAGQTTKEMQKEFQQLAMIMGTLHMPTENVQATMRAFEQMYSKGKLQGEEMRQIANSLPGSYAIVTTAVGKTGYAFSDAMKKGQVITSDFMPKFLEQLGKFYHVDFSKPIQTLQAAITRLGNAWNFFNVALGSSFGVVNVFVAALDGITTGLNWLAQNMITVASYIGGFAGAIVGATIALAAFSIVNGIVSAISAMSIAVGGITSLTELWTAAQLALDAAMDINPIMLFAGVIGALVATFLGAKFGADALSQAVRQNQLAMSNTSGLETFIDAQRRARTATDETIDAMVKQAKAMLMIKTQNLTESNSRLQVQRQDVASKTYTQQHGELTGGSQYGVGVGYNWGHVDRTAVIQAAKDTNDANKAVRDQIDLVKSLQGLKSMPITSTTPPAISTKPPKVKKAPDPERGLEAVRDLLLELDKANDAMNALFAGPDSEALLGDLQKAKDQLDHLKPDQVGQLTEYLKNAGQWTGNLQGSLQMVVTKTRLAKETFDDFNKVWKSIKDGNLELQHTNQLISFLTSGGDPDQMYLVRAFQKADEMLKGFSADSRKELAESLKALSGVDSNAFSPEAIEGILGAFDKDRTAGLTALSAKLDELGIHGKTTADQLAVFFGRVESGAHQLDLGTSAVTKLRDSVIAYRTGQAQLTSTNLSGFLNVDYIAKATSELKGITDQGVLTRMADQLKAVGIAADPNNLSVGYAQFLRQIDDQATAVDRLKSAYERAAGAWSDFASSALDDIKGLITGTESFGDAILNVVKKLGDTILDVSIFDPLKANISQMLQDRARGSGPTMGMSMGANLLNGLQGSPTKSAFGGNTGLLDPTMLASTQQALSSLGVGATSAAGSMTGNLIPGLAQTALTTGTETAAKATSASMTTGAAGSLMMFTNAVNSASFALMQMIASMGGGSGGGLFKSILNIGMAAFMHAPPVTGASVTSGISNLSTIDFSNFGMYAGGGLLQGAGGPREDKIPLLASDGEFIVNAEATRKWLPFLAKLNAGMLPHFATGGPVSGGSLGFSGVADKLYSATMSGSLAGGGDHTRLLMAQRMVDGLTSMRGGDSSGASPTAGVMGGPAAAGNDLYVPGTSDGGSRSPTMQGSTVHMDARTTIHAPGQGDDQLRKMRAMLDDRDRKWQKTLPQLVDARVMDSSSRGRYGGR